MREKKFVCMQCMSQEEMQKPDLLVKSAKRKRQLARDSGRTQAEVNDLLTTFTQMRVQMKTMSKMMAQSGGMGVFFLLCPATIQAPVAEVSSHRNMHTFQWVRQPYHQFFSYHQFSAALYIELLDYPASCSVDAGNARNTAGLVAVCGCLCECSCVR
jgi:Signal peptide binding domain